MLFKRMIADDLFTLVEHNNAALAQSFTNSVWRPHQSTIDEISRTPFNQWIQNPNYLEFSRQAFKFFEDMPVAKISVYLPDRTLLFASNQLRILHQNSEELPKNTLFSVSDALRGEPQKRILFDHGFITPSGQYKEAVLVHTIAPISNDHAPKALAASGNNTPYIGMIEIFYDATDSWEAIGWFQWVSTLGIIAVFILLLIALIMASRRSEAIIAKQHEVNLELAATAAAAEAESRNKEMFLANISHELRTPLNAIIGFSQILGTELDGTLSDTHKTYISDINSSGSHLLSLINDILDYSKAEAGKLELSLRETNLTKLIKNNMRVVYPRAEEGQITLAEDLPYEQIVINTDSKKLKQALLNLLSNSVKFTPAGGEVRVSMWENVVDSTISIEVRDTGIGIEQKNISKVLSPFGQVENNLDRKYEGTGLGLPLAKKFIEAMGGQFKIESEVGKGTAINLTLPAEKPEDAPQTSENEGSNAPLENKENAGLAGIELSLPPVEEEPKTEQPTEDSEASPPPVAQPKEIIL